MADWKISNKGIKFICDREGCVLTAYPDPPKSTTNFAIGYGSTKMLNGDKVKKVMQLHRIKLNNY